MNEFSPITDGTEDTKYDDIFSKEPLLPQQTVKEAAVEKPEVSVSANATETDRQMGIAAADRANRKAAGLPPRVYSLK